MAGAWEELKSIFEYWIGHGVKIFRVDNPHTKAFGFWEWAIRGIKAEHADVLFLAEAFTRPKIMYRLAKLGFDQSYTYFTWRNSKTELTEYFEELAKRGFANTSGRISGRIRRTSCPRSCKREGDRRSFSGWCWRHAGSELWHLRSSIRAM